MVLNGIKPLNNGNCKRDILNKAVTHAPHDAALIISASDFSWEHFCSNSVVFWW